MKTSWNETAEAEKYIWNAMSAEEFQCYKAKLSASPLRRLNLFYQEKLYALILLFHRKKLKEETEALHRNLFSDPAKSDFQQNIYKFFKN